MIYEADAEEYVGLTLLHRATWAPNSIETSTHTEILLQNKDNDPLYKNPLKAPRSFLNSFEEHYGYIPKHTIHTAPLCGWCVWEYTHRDLNSHRDIAAKQGQ